MWFNATPFLEDAEFLAVYLYYFDVEEDGEVGHDAHGIELAGDDEAHKEALGLLVAIARDAILKGEQHELLTWVRDRRGEVIYEATLSLRGRRPGQDGEAPPASGPDRLLS